MSLPTLQTGKRIKYESPTMAKKHRGVGCKIKVQSFD